MPSVTAPRPLLLACLALGVWCAPASGDAVVEERGGTSVTGRGVMRIAFTPQGGELRISGIDGQRVELRDPCDGYPPPQPPPDDPTEPEPAQGPTCERPPARCRAEADAVICPGDVATNVVGTDAGDLVRIARGASRLQVDGGAGDDRIETASYRDVALTPGPGDDTVDLSTFAEGVQFWGPQFETIIGSPHNDVLHTHHQGQHRPTATRAVSGGGGDDVLDVRDGVPTRVDCGGHQADRVIADDDDAVASCALIERVTPRPAVGQLPRGLVPPHVDPRWRALGLAASPQLLGDVLRLELATIQGATAVATVSVGPWRAAAELVPLPGVPAGPGDGQVPLAVTVPLPPDVLAALAADARVRANLRLLLRHPLGDTEVREGRFTIVRLPPWPGVVNGRRLIGTFGIQRLVGSPLGDLLDGRSADDVLMGLGGSDRLTGGTGNDRLFGGEGDDLIDGLDGDDRHHGGQGDDHLVETRFGDDRLDGGEGDDVLIGLRGRDELLGGPGDDILDGGSGPDTMDCGPGEDVAFINNSRDRSLARNCEELHDGAGVVARACDQGGSPASETVLGTEGDDLCSAGDGDDDVEGRGGHDTLLGGGGRDRIFGRFGVDDLQGGDGDDELEGGRDADALDGGAGEDALNGGLGPDVVRGGPGADRVTARGGGADRVDCGAGRDVAIVDSSDRVRNCERVSRSGTAPPRRRRS
jgi:Ca2+-binding RTX toxin-like protein